MTEEKKGYNTNVIVINGNLTKDAELKDVGEGDKKSSVMMFTLANNSDSVTTYVKIEEWGPHAKAMAPILKKGMKVQVVGKLRIDQVPDKDDKEKNNYYTKVVAKEIEILSKKQD